MEVLVLRLDGPLISFGGVQVDQNGVTDAFPGASLLTGMLANALGYDHRDWQLTQDLQHRLRYAVRQDRAGQPLRDFQTIALGQDFLTGTGWTTSRRIEARAGASSMATHIRYRHFRADALYTVVVALDPPDGEPHLGALGDALIHPERPLFIGRKPCLPSAPIFVGKHRTASLRDALTEVPRVPHRSDPGALSAWWPGVVGDTEANSRLIPVTDTRDWRNQIHVGQRLVAHGQVNPPEVA